MKKIYILISILTIVFSTQPYAAQIKCPILKSSHLLSLMNHQDVVMEDQSKWMSVDYRLKNDPGNLWEYRKGWGDFIKVAHPTTEYPVQFACTYQNVGHSAYSKYTKDQIKQRKDLQETYNIGKMVVGSPVYHKLHNFYEIEVLTIKMFPNGPLKG